MYVFSEKEEFYVILKFYFMQYVSTSYIQSILNQEAINTHLLRDIDDTHYEPKCVMIKTKTFYHFIPFNSLPHLLACWVFLLRPGIFYYLGNKNCFLLFLENLLLLTIYQFNFID